MIWGGIRMPRTAIALSLMASAAFVLPAAAQDTQNTQQPTSGGTVGPDSLRDFSLGGTQRPNPTPSQPAPSQTTPTTTPTPAPSSTADRLAAPIRLPSGQQGSARPPAQQPQQQQAGPRPTGQRPNVAPVTGQQIQPTQSLPEISQPQLQDDGFIPVPQQAPQRQPSFTPLPGEEKQDWPWWNWAAAALGLVALGSFFLRRRRTAMAGSWEEEALKETPVAERSAAQDSPLGTAPVAPPPPPPTTKGLTVEAKHDLRFTLTPLKATLTAEYFAVDYELRISNRGSGTANSLGVNVGMIMAGPEQDKAIEALVDHPPESIGNRVAELRAQNAVTMKGSARVPLSVLRVVTVENRQLLLPILVFTARVAASDGGDVLVKAGHAAWLIGRKGGADGRMAPLRTDQGARVWRDLDCRKQ